MVDVSGNVEQYFNSGYSYNEIIGVLRERHQVTVSIRQLHRILRRKGLYRKGHHSQTSEVIHFINEELLGSGCCVGYRSMHQRCLRRGFRVPRNNVAIIQKVLDSGGVEFRRRNCLRRRLYYANGPNWVWHIDGYDKLKPYGLSIHGAIDGFSRRVMWLRLSRSNKNPNIVCSHFVNTVLEVQGTPRKIVGDRGTENVYLAAAQRFFRQSHTDSCSGMNSFQYGRSVSNQRIEAWWSMLRRSCTNWWINCFKDLVEQGLVDLTDQMHVECVRFCFGEVLQNELDQIRINWNNHRIRPSVNSNQRFRPSGRPNILYFTPSICNPSLIDYKYSTNIADVEIVTEMCCQYEDNDYIFAAKNFSCWLILL